VDSLCVTHNTWMVDSGTLGSKGNTQVVIPFVSESYSSSSDPPEEDIPLCTLKSFPYQPEHCVAWARSKFDQLFSADLKTLQSCLEIPEFKGPESSVDSESVLSSVGALLLSAEEISRLLGALTTPQTTPKAAVEWAMRTFDSTYRVEAEKLLQEHPLGEVDENGVLFWGG
jgi:ubiquitin-activating enzyme E1